jgi:predicted translin family RNA/ssDNA-binding protein
MVNRKRIKGGFYFRHFGKNYKSKKPGLYLCNLWEKIDKSDRISDKKILEITEWLNRYCNQFIHKAATTSFEETRSKARAVVRAVEILEAHVKDLK